ncbi:MAG: hypothetical protein ACRCZI_11135 [Cetobacterium sp.]
MSLLLLVVLWLLFGVFSGVIAVSKNRSGFFWLLLGFLFGPFALFAVGVMPASPGAPSGAWRQCPACHAKIDADASRCRYCTAESAPPTADELLDAEAEARTRGNLAALIGLALFVALVAYCERQ